MIKDLENTEMLREWSCSDWRKDNGNKVTTNTEERDSIYERGINYSHQ